MFKGLDLVIKTFFILIYRGRGDWDLKIFISGGSKSGKSMYAQQIARNICKPGMPLYYLATMIPTDGEDEARITRHREEREGWGFVTVEAGRDLLKTVEFYNESENCDESLNRDRDVTLDESGTFLLDSVTALLANEMFLPDGNVVQDAYIKVTNDLEKVLSRVDDMVIVSDYIYSDAILYDELTELYRRGLAYIDKRMAVLCDVVVEVCCGLTSVHKGEEYIREYVHGVDYKHMWGFKFTRD